jgi:excinuclease UvrABC nuclease subunit|nr:MAG TPA: intron associated endonuclease [Caudoviricetes sp.]
MITLKLDDLFEFKKDGQYQFEDTPGVYAIVNLLNNKKYIGSSSSIRRRYRQHFNELSNDKHANPILQKAFNKYG